jgi:hypothetical protein
MINVAFDGKKLFDWDGDASAVARIDEETTRIAKLANTSPQALWQSALVHINENGGRLFGSNQEAEIMIVTWGLMTAPTQHPDRPGIFGDYLELWNFDFNIKIDPEDKKRFTVEVKGGFTAKGTA